MSNVYNDSYVRMCVASTILRHRRFIGIIFILYNPLMEPTHAYSHKYICPHMYTHKFTNNNRKRSKRMFRLGRLYVGRRFEAASSVLAHDGSDIILCSNILRLLSPLQPLYLAFAFLDQYDMHFAHITNSTREGRDWIYLQWVSVV